MVHGKQGKEVSVVVVGGMKVDCQAIAVSGISLVEAEGFSLVQSCRSEERVWMKAGQGFCKRQLPSAASKRAGTGVAIRWMRCEGLTAQGDSALTVQLQAEAGSSAL